MIFRLKLGSVTNCSRVYSANIRRYLRSFTFSPGSVQFCTGAGPSHDAKFAKLWSAKDRVLVSDAKSTASDSPAHFQGQHKIGEAPGTLHEHNTHFDKTILLFARIVE